MRFSLLLSSRFFIWSIILGFVIGIFGITLAITKIADFYLKEGTQQKSNTYSYKILPSSTKILDTDTIIDLQNIEGIGFVDPYFKPTTTVEGSINYFGFSASQNIQLNGIPKRLGEKKANINYKNFWDSTDLESIPILLPVQVITLYNNIAPQKGWPSLSKEAFIGLPGLKVNIQGKEYNAVLTGFDADEFGTTINSSAQKLFAIYDNLYFNPSYSFIMIETVPGLNKSQARKIAKKISDLGYQIASASEENFQQGIFIRIKYIVLILGFGILIAFIFLFIYNITSFLNQFTNKIWLYRIWGIKETIGLRTLLISIIFSLLTAIIAWTIAFFAIIPAQKYIIDTITQFGINTPSLRESTRTSLETGVFGLILFFTITFITLIKFYLSIPKANYIKKL